MCFLFRNEVTTFAESVHILLLTGKKTDKFRKCEIYIVYMYVNDNSLHVENKCVTKRLSNDQPKL